MGVAQRLKTYRALAQRASDEHGVAVLTQLRELRQLRRSLGRIGPADYYNYRLGPVNTNCAEANPLRQ